MIIIEFFTDFVYNKLRKESVMKCTVIIDKDREEEVVVTLHAPSPLADGIRELCLADERRICAFDGGGALMLSPSEVFAFTVDDGKTYAVTASERQRVRLRLYEIEKIVGQSFMKINQSCLVNVSLVRRFYASFGGALSVEMKNGYKDFVSRRQIKAVKERMGIK